MLKGGKNSEEEDEDNEDEDEEEQEEDEDRHALKLVSHSHVRKGQWALTERQLLRDNQGTQPFLLK